MSDPNFVLDDAIEVVTDTVEAVKKGAKDVTTSKTKKTTKTHEPSDTRGTVRIITHNVKNYPDLPRPTVVNIGKRLSNLGGIIALQEIGEGGQDANDILKGLNASGKHHFVLNNHNDSNPVAVNTDWWHIKGAFKHSIWMDKSFHSLGWGNLTITGVHLKDKHSNLPDFWVTSTHMAVGGYGVNAKRKNPTTWQKRQHEWNLEHTEISRIVDTLDAPVFTCGDLNNRGAKPFGRNSRWLHHVHLDFIGYSNRQGHSVKVLDRWQQHDASDHPIVGVKVNFGAA